MGTYTTYCLTQALYLCSEMSIHLCTASTDGHISFWSLNSSLGQSGITTTKDPTRIAFSSPQLPFPSERGLEEIKWHSRTKIHQSSIKAMCSLPLIPSTFLLATGGDDGALGFTRVTCTTTNPSVPDPESLSRSILLIPNAHAAAITAITSLGPWGSRPSVGEEQSADPHTQWHTFATTSPDQKVQIWRVSIDLEKPGVEGLRVEKGDNVSTAVADAACLEAFAWEYDDDNDDLDLNDDSQKQQDTKNDTPTQSNPRTPNAKKPQTHENISDGNKAKNQNLNIHHDSNSTSMRKTEPRIQVLVAGIGIELWSCVDV